MWLAIHRGRMANGLTMALEKIQCNRALIATGHGLILVGCIPEVKLVLREARLHEALLTMSSFDEAILSLSGETIEMC